MTSQRPHSVPYTDSNFDPDNKENAWKWMNKLIALINRVIEKSLANPVNFRRSVNNVITEFLDDFKHEDGQSPKFGDGPVLTIRGHFEETCGSFKHLHLRPLKHGGVLNIDVPQFEAVRGILTPEGELDVDSLDTLMAYAELKLDSPKMELYPLSTWQDTKPAPPTSPSWEEPQENGLIDKLDDLYPLKQPKVATKTGHKVVPPWSVPMPWNFDKARDTYDNQAIIPLYLQGMTIHVDWSTYTIRPTLTRAQERRTEEISPDMEMANLHMLGQRMLFACARLNDWVRYMNEARQVIPLHTYLAGTVLANDAASLTYRATEHIIAGFTEWREDPPGYLECIRPSECEENDGSSSSTSNLWDSEEEDCVWSDDDNER